MGRGVGVDPVFLLPRHPIPAGNLSGGAGTVQGTRLGSVAEHLDAVLPPTRIPLVETVTIRLPEAPEHELLLVLHWRRGDSKPLMLLVSPAARLAGRTGPWFVKAYRRRWGVEDATRGIKQRFHLEQFLVRSWRSIRRLIALVALAFYWLNFWGDDGFQKLRQAFLRHRWQLPKEVTYLFDWLATQIHVLLHPKPKITHVEEDYSG